MFRFFSGVVSALLLVVGGFMVFAAIAATEQIAQARPWGIPAAWFALGGLFLASVTTFTGVYFGWRKDRREARVLQLQVEKLQLECNQLKRQLEQRSKSRKAD